MTHAYIFHVVAYSFTVVANPFSSGKPIIAGWHETHHFRSGTFTNRYWPWPFRATWGSVSRPSTLQHVDRRIELPTLWWVDKLLYLPNHSHPRFRHLDWWSSDMTSFVVGHRLFSWMEEMIVRAGKMGLLNSECEKESMRKDIQKMYSHICLPLRVRAVIS